MTTLQCFAASVLAAAIFGSVPPASARNAPLNDPASLNIGFICRWDTKCMRKQEKAMSRAHRYVRSKRPPALQVQQCDRNASRGYGRVDWVGFNNCIRNRAIRSVAKPVAKPARRSLPPPPPRRSYADAGERG